MPHAPRHSVVVSVLMSLGGGKQGSEITNFVWFSCASHLKSEVASSWTRAV